MLTHLTARSQLLMATTKNPRTLLRPKVQPPSPTRPSHERVRFSDFPQQQKSFSGCFFSQRRYPLRQNVHTAFLCRMIVQQILQPSSAFRLVFNCTARAQHSVFAFFDLICLRRLDLAHLILSFFLHSTLRAGIGTGGERRDRRILESRATNGVFAIRPFHSCFSSKVFSSAVGPCLVLSGGVLINFSRAFRP
jgi:hypothetical protein